VLIAAVLAALLLLSAPGEASWSLTAALTEYLKSNYPWTEIVVSDARLQGTQPQALPANIAIEGGSPLGNARFRLEFGNGSVLAATAKVRAYDRVVLARRSLNRGTVVRGEDVFEAVLDTTRMPRNAVQDSALIVGKTAGRTIPANLPITEDMVAAGAQVRRGARITLLCEAPGFSVRTRGELQRAGTVGEYVPVLNPLSKKVVTGLLVDANTVRVEF